MKTINTKTVLEVKKISKHFPGVQALKEVSLSLREGEVHAVIGENGAGKSTLMKIIFGLLQPDAGEIYWNGRRVVIDSPIAAQRLGIGIVPQELNLVPQLTVAENILLGVEPRKRFGLIDWNKMRKDAAAILETVGEIIDIKRTTAELSVAQQQIVQIARALAFGARVLIYDEPTASLTQKETEGLFKIINSFIENKGSVFYISHRLEEILRIAHRITVLRDGCYITELNPKQTTTDEMVRYMVGREIKKAKRTARRFDEAKTPVLEVENLARRGEFSGISFRLYPGEILGIAGLVGAGRTELVRCIFGETQPDEGTIKIGQKEIKHPTPAKSIRNGVGFLPEERRKLGLFPVLPVSQNMTMSTLKKYKKWGRINQRQELVDVNKYIEELKIKTPHPRQLVKNLSGGNQQKVILARWMLTGCKILILDEPTRGIDVGAKAEIFQLLQEMVALDYAVVLISSELQEVIDYADRILIMHEGRLKGEVKGTETTQEEIMRIALS
ncbi:sugar ABC transporter ATP-binding protein [Capillibacterium thermochitinicola]|uniref:Sugar ABC transporter ATP-binding protein n=1 Tax=Capillibacterium thermochitinicola TaxID=2699427 RepID=A0A8J6HYE8_9FIRM|nr:sugar ABC transporter ATP-binding protein [Capillibacterium thermochitinicola]